MSSAPRKRLFRRQSKPFCFVVVSPYIAEKLSLVVSVAAITLWPFVFFRKEPDALTLRHEKIHIAQQAELLIVGFYAIYVFDWVVGMLRGRTSEQAYEEIRFEAEAYTHEGDEHYLERRPRFAWARS